MGDDELPTTDDEGWAEANDGDVAPSTTNDQPESAASEPSTSKEPGTGGDSAHHDDATSEPSSVISSEQSGAASGTIEASSASAPSAPKPPLAAVPEAIREPAKESAPAPPKAPAPPLAAASPPREGRSSRQAAPRPTPPPDSKAPKPRKPPKQRTPRDGSSGPPETRTRMRWILAAIVLIGISAIVVMSMLNEKRFFLVCHPESITAERGRLLPWGQTQLEGDQWAPIPIDEAFPCEARELDSRQQLSQLFAEALIERSEREIAQESPAIDTVARQLDQALLLTRGDKQRRARVERLSGDVDYLRGKRSVDSAAVELRKALELYRSAATKRPVHARDAGAWGNFSQSLLEEIELGPVELRPAPPPSDVVIPIPEPPRDPKGQDIAPRSQPTPPAEEIPAPQEPSPAKPEPAPARGGVLL